MVRKPVSAVSNVKLKVWTAAATSKKSILLTTDFFLVSKTVETTLQCTNVLS